MNMRNSNNDADLKKIVMLNLNNVNDSMFNLCISVITFNIQY